MAVKHVHQVTFGNSSALYLLELSRFAALSFPLSAHEECYHPFCYDLPGGGILTDWITRMDDHEQLKSTEKTSSL
jgi:hypothetical protein